MIRVLGDRVLVALPPKEHVQEAVTGFTYQEVKTAGGLIIAKQADEYNVEIATRGIVVSLGEKSNTVDLDVVRAELNEFFLTAEADLNPLASLKDRIDRLVASLGPAPFDVEIGDCILFSPSAGDQFSKNGVDYVVLHESEILGVLQPTQKEAA